MIELVRSFYRWRHKVNLEKARRLKGRIGRIEDCAMNYYRLAQRLGE